MPPLSPKTLRVAGQALGFTDEAGDAIRQLSKPIRAYHGSPYDFDAFDASKIGTGEGAQAYGHGLYFAGNEAVAKDYRDRLKGMVDAPVPEALGDELQGVIKEVRRLAERRSAAKGDEWHALDRALADLHVRHQDVQHRIREASYNPGHMYEVEIGYPEEALLDYDRPFATPGGIRGAAVLRQENPDILTKPMLRALRDGSWRFESYAGWQNAAEALARLPKTQSGAQALMEAGVPGVRYLDQGSRAAGDGTRNYVIFPGAEDRIRILRKYGLLAPMAAGAAMEEQ